MGLSFFKAMGLTSSKRVRYSFLNRPSYSCKVVADQDVTGADRKSVV